MQINIRPGTEDDLGRLMQLIHEFATFQKSGSSVTNSQERMKEEQEHLNFLVAETPTRKIIGYLAFFECYFTWSGKGIQMDDLYVQPEFRGMGLGKQLMEYLMAYAKKKGCHSVKWQVSRWNEKAVAFYRLIGAKITDEELECELKVT